MAKISLIALLCLLVLLGVALTGVMVRLNSGPVPLAFLTGTVERIINTTLGKARVDISDAVIERDGETGAPHLRLRNIAVYDENGTVIARAPRAAVGFDFKDIFSGHLRPNSLELIGPRILVRRKMDGTLDLGFGATGFQPSSPSDLKTDIGAATPSLPPSPPAAETDTADVGLADFINRDLLGPSDASAMASLSGITISDASISLYDERNQAVWYAPRVNLAFKRVSYGFALFADAAVASGKTPWRTEVAAHYRRATRRFAVTARVYDLIPADLSDQVFALSQLAQVRLPLSGQADLEISDAGQILSASAELTAKPGMVNFPDYIAEPIAVQRGNLKLAYDPASGDVNLADSSVDLDGADTALTGKMEQVRDGAGLLQSLHLTLTARNQSSRGKAGAFTSFSFSGAAFIHEGRFDVDDFTLAAGPAEVKLAGSFSEGRETAGITLTGKAKDLPASLVKRLWPPIIAPNSRHWINENVSAGSVPQAQIAVNLPAEALAALFRHEPLPDAALDLRFSLADVSLKFLEAAPPITGADGDGHITGRTLGINLGGGKVTLASGRTVNLVKGVMTVPELSVVSPPAVFDITASGKADAALELLDLPPLGYASAGGLKAQDAGGDVSAQIQIGMPLRKLKTASEASVKGQAKITNASLANQYPGVTLGNGTIAVAVDQGNVTVGGDLKVNGMPARMAWARTAGQGGDVRQSLSLEADLDDAARAKINPALNAFVQGPIHIAIRTLGPDARMDHLKVDADVSQASLHFDPLRWTRAPNGKAKMSFEADMSVPDQTVIRDLVISGQNLDVKGTITVGPGGTLVEANLPNITLDPMNAFSVQLRRQSGTLDVKVKGQRFDARGLINTLFKRTVIPPGADLPVPITIDAAVQTLYANRDETVQNVTAKLDTLGSFVRVATINGTLPNGTAVDFTIKPDASGIRIMRVTAKDGGSVLRATNLYSKVAGGVLDFYAELGTGNDAAIRRGQVILRDFEIRNEAALAEIDRQGRVQSSAKRGDSLAFERFTMPFTADANFVRIGDSMMRGPELGASATGTIRKADGAIDIGGTIIPAYALNSVVSKVPLLGPVIAGGRGQGIFGLNFALRGTMDKPRFVVNPLSAVAPGFLRRFFEIGGGGVNPDGTPMRPANTDSRAN